MEGKLHHKCTCQVVFVSFPFPFRNDLAWLKRKRKSTRKSMLQNSRVEFSSVLEGRVMGRPYLGLSSLQRENASNSQAEFSSVFEGDGSTISYCARFGVRSGRSSAGSVAAPSLSASSSSAGVLRRHLGHLHSLCSSSCRARACLRSCFRISSIGLFQSA